MQNFENHFETHKRSFVCAFPICMTAPLRKEINRLLSKGMPNIYLKVTIETFSKL